MTRDDTAERGDVNKPVFGEWFTGVYASDDNPKKHGMYVRTIRRSSSLGKRVMNPGTFYELTDGHGRFWQYPINSIVRRAPRNVTEPDSSSVRYSATEPMGAAVARPTNEVGVLGLSGGVDPVCLVHGKRRSEHDCLYCTLCFKPLTKEECSYLPDGTQVNVCVPCAENEQAILVRIAQGDDPRKKRSER